MKPEIKELNGKPIHWGHSGYTTAGVVEINGETVAYRSGSVHIVLKPEVALEAVRGGLSFWMWIGNTGINRPQLNDTLEVELCNKCIHRGRWHHDCLRYAGCCSKYKKLLRKLQIEKMEAEKDEKLREQFEQKSF